MTSEIDAIRARLLDAAPDAVFTHPALLVALNAAKHLAVGEQDHLTRRVLLADVASAEPFIRAARRRLALLHALGARDDAMERDRTISRLGAIAVLP
jgi:hypothetical protein